MIKRTAARRRSCPWYLWLVGCHSGPRVDAAAIIEVLACDHFHHREATGQSVPRRFSEFRPATWVFLLRGMALLGLLLLPATYRAGAESAHAHSLIQLWADAANGSIRHHLDGLADPAPGRSSSWFDPSVGDSRTNPSVGFDDVGSDAAAQQESAPVSSGVHLLLTTITVIVALGLCREPIDVPDQRHSGLSPRILVPPPRWTPAAQ
jgi:hypothetical protein